MSELRILPMESLGRDFISGSFVPQGEDEYYLRNLTMCIVQGIVRMQFNCDGTQIIDAHNFKSFLEDNI